jgi:hypothetical protein
MRGWQAIKKYFNIAYRPAKEGMRYEEIPGSGATKTVVESISAVLVLYASYSELSEKVLKAFFLEQSYYASTIGRLVTCLLGIFVCLHILFARKPGDPAVFAYSKIPRLFGGIIFWLVLASLAITSYELANETRTSVGLNSGYYELPATECQPTIESKGRYVCRLLVPPGYKEQYRDLKVVILPTGDFLLESVTPFAKEKIVLLQSQEPLEAGKFNGLRSSWEFPQFDSGNDWRMMITLGKTNAKETFPEQAPLRITIYFYK